MGDIINIRYVWLIMVLRKKLENRPYELSCEELELIKTHEQKYFNTFTQ